MKKAHAYPLFLLLLSLLTCQKETISLSGSGGQPEPVATDETRTYSRVAGYVQKGPFLNGTSIELAELDERLGLTGNTFTSQILDNRGTFAFRDVTLASQHAQLRADGFYYNEVTGENSAAQLTLYALIDITKQTEPNVNLLSHLERSRMAYLMDEGTDFATAKQRAQREILTIFEMEQEQARYSDALDISLPGSDNAKLLAASVILQGYLSVADFSELLANISTDIREDGVLDSKSLGSQLINNARLLKPASIRTNLEQRYEQLGQQVVVPEFELHLAHFIAHTDFEFTNDIAYPETGKHGPNILDPTLTDISVGEHSMVAELPEATKLRVKISGGNWVFPVFPTDKGWEYTELKRSDTSRVFTSVQTGLIDFKIIFTRLPRIADPGHPYTSLLVRDTLDQDTVKTDPQIPPPPPPPSTLPRRTTRIELYENGAEEPRWTKVFSVDR